MKKVAPQLYRTRNITSRSFKGGVNPAIVSPWININTTGAKKIRLVGLFYSAPFAID